jgi:hypothetical protein
VALSASGAAIDGGTFALNNNGYTRDIAPTLSGGTYPLVAKYSGDNSYTASTSATDTFTVTPASTQLAITNNPRPIVSTPVTLSVLGVPNVATGAAATGSISIYDGTATIGGPVPVSPVYSGQGVPADFNASVQVTYLTSGDHQITAKYSGDANYAASTSSPLTVHPLYPTTMMLTQSVSNVNYGQSVTITATITTSIKNPPITGTFTFGFANAVTVSGTPGTDASGNQTLTASATMTPQGNTVAQINYGGDSNFEAAADTSFITVNIPDFTLGPANGLTVVATAGQPGSAQLTLAPATQTPSTVTLSYYPPNAVAGYTLSFSPQQVSLNGSATTATLSLTPLGSAPQATIRRSTRHSGFLVLSRRNGDWWSLGLVSGLAALLLLGLPGRDRRYRIALGFSAACFLCFAIGCGGGGNSGAGSGAGTSPTPTSTTLTTSIAKVDQNTQFVLTMKVTGQHPLTGTVTLFDNGTAVLGGFSLINGEAQTTGGFGGIFQIGIHQLTATYVGDPENLTSTSSAATQVITGTNQIFITGNTGADSHNISATVVLQ